MMAALLNIVIPVAMMLIVVVVVTMRESVMRIVVVIVDLDVPKYERSHAADDAGEQADAQAGAENTGTFGCGVMALVGRICRRLTILIVIAAVVTITVGACMMTAHGTKQLSISSVYLGTTQEFFMVVGAHTFAFSERWEESQNNK